MEFQIINEISKIWETLVPAIFLGIVSILLFLWVIGSQNLEKIMKRFVERRDSKYVLQNGIYVPKEQTIRYKFTRKLLSKLGFDSLKPSMTIFLILLFFFGLNRILMQIFLPLLTYRADRILYSSGCDDYILASIWAHYPQIQSSSQLYDTIMKLTENTKVASNIFQYAVEAFIRFDLLCCVVFFLCIIFRLKRQSWVNKGVIMRLVALVCILVAALIGNIFFQMQRINKDIDFRCQKAFSILKENSDETAKISWEEQNIRIDDYMEDIKQEREQYGDYLYYGAFNIRNRFAECVSGVVKEIRRIFLRRLDLVSPRLILTNRSPMWRNCSKCEKLQARAGANGIIGLDPGADNERIYWQFMETIKIYTRLHKIHF